MRSEQGSHLVPVELVPLARGRVGGADGGTVGVGIIGKHDVGTHLLCQRERQVHGAGFLRVGEGNGGEVRIRAGLFGHRVDVFETGFAEHRQGRLVAHPMHGRVDNPQLTGREMGRVRQGHH